MTDVSPQGATELEEPEDPESHPEAIADELFGVIFGGPLESMKRWRAQSLSMDQVHVLLACRSLGSMTMSHLAELRGVSLPNATGIVARLEERGLLERLHDEQDRRLVMVRLTHAGGDAVTEVEQARRRYLVRVLEAMSPRERREFARAFRNFFEISQRLVAEHLAESGQDAVAGSGRESPDSPGMPDAVGSRVHSGDPRP